MSNRQDQIKQDVIEQLKWDSRVAEFNILVHVLEHTVVLEGVVSIDNKMTIVPTPPALST
jgi:osmotically-inducible protein OsmY